MQDVLSSPYFALDINLAAGVLNEHSAAISNVFVDRDEIITDDYDGVVIAREAARKRLISARISNDSKLFFCLKKF